MLAADSKVVLCGNRRIPCAPNRPIPGKQIIDPVEPFLEAVSDRLAQQVEAFDPESPRTPITP